ncbi:MAG: SLBB domain-containing protein [Armatimonadetes bacterium]|nr:SLBB domain-containing protein [Armatimonadota bacterium]
MGYLQAENLTAEAFAARIDQSFKQRGVSLTSQIIRLYDEAEPVLVEGAVVHPGQLRVGKGLSLAQLAQIAAPSDLADPDGIVIESWDGKVITGSLNLTPDLQLKPGDRVSFQLNTRPLQVFVLGAVVKPGAIEWKANMTALDAVTGAGGIAPYAVEARTTIERQSETFPYRPTVTLQRGDIIRVPESPQKEYVSLVGAFKHPGMMRIGAGLHLTDLIRLSQGFDARADRRAIVLRRLDGKAIKINYNVIKIGGPEDVLIKTGDILEAPFFGGVN